MPKQMVQTNLAPTPRSDFSQAWVVTGGRTIYVAGQVPVDFNGNLVGVGNIALQTRTVFENIKGVLKGAGATMQDVVKLNLYVTNMAEFREKARPIRREYFPKDFPAATLIEVKSLADPGYMVEIEAIAAVG